MTPFELSVVELLRMAPTPLYSMYRAVTDRFAGAVSMASFFELVDCLIGKEIVQLWWVYGAGEERRLEAVPPDLEIYYSKVELDRSFDPFGFVLVAGPRAPVGEEPDWEVDVDFEAGTFTIAASSETAPEDVHRALRLLGPCTFVEQRRIADGEKVRIEGIVTRAEGVTDPAQ